MSKIIKGGPGSGHHGHHGRPGKRGGSAPSQMLNLFSSISLEEAEPFRNTLVRWQIPEHHLEGLQSIRDSLLDDEPWPDDMGGYYYIDEKVISVHPQEIQPQSMLVHELGHHVTQRFFDEHGMDDAEVEEWGRPVLERLREMSEEDVIMLGLRPDTIGDIFETISDSYVTWMHDSAFSTDNPVFQDALANLWQLVDLDMNEVFKRLSIWW